MGKFIEVSAPDQEFLIKQLDNKMRLWSQMGITELVKCRV